MGYDKVPRMPRKARIDAPGAIHHIICRGLERREIFYDNEDRDDFVSRLSRVLNDTSTRCFAWALIPNHFHLLLQTGSTPIATFMRRLLTGYAVTFNRRHDRHGHLFQNRYKSILCQEEPYLLELVRYIHLNPLRSGIVSSLEELERYRYSGHGQLMGRYEDSWLATDDILLRFAKTTNPARKIYSAFVAEGVDQGRRPELTGGGLLRSAGGWREISAMYQAGIHIKSDERILGDGGFVESVLQETEDRIEAKSLFKRQGIDLERLAKIVADHLAMDVGEVWARGKQPKRVAARNLLCCWAVRELGFSATALAARLNLTQSAVTRTVQRGEKLAAESGWFLEQMINA
jgi:putative transposase